MPLRTLTIAMLIAGLWLGAENAPAQAPANDAFTHRLALNLTGDSLSVTGSNLGATVEPGEPSIYHGLGRTVWYEWQAPFSGPVTLDIVSPTGVEYFGVYVFTGAAVDDLRWVTLSYFRQDDRRQSLLDAREGTRYVLLVEKVEWPFFGPGDFLLRLGRPAVPANDAFAGRLTLSGRAAVASGSTLAATREPGDPIPANAEGVHSLWWTWTAPGTGLATLAGLDPAGLPGDSGFQPTVGIYTGHSLATLAEVTNNWTSHGPLTDLDFPVTAGTTYQILIAAKSGERGPVGFTLTLDGAALLGRPQPGATGELAFDLVGAPWTFYRIERTADFQTWQPLTTVHCIYAPVRLEFPRDPGAAGHWFRAVLEPQ